MSSIVDVTTRTAPAIMLIEAMTRETGRGDLFEKFNVPQIPLTSQHTVVSLTINGTEVDFVKTAQEMWERLESRYEEDVLAKAKELVSRSRLNKLNDIISRVEYELEEEIDKLFSQR